MRVGRGVGDTEQQLEGVKVTSGEREAVGVRVPETVGGGERVGLTESAALPLEEAER